MKWETIELCALKIMETSPSTINQALRHFGLQTPWCPMRLKDRIQVIDTFPNLTGYPFRYEWQPEGHKKTCGCMLEHVEGQAPEATENGQVFLEKLVPFLIEKIKRLGRRIDTLKKTQTNRKNVYLGTL